MKYNRYIARYIFEYPLPERVLIIAGQLSLAEAMQIARNIHPTAVIEVSPLGADEV